MKKLLIFIFLLPLIVKAQEKNLLVSFDIGSNSATNIDIASNIGFRTPDNSIIEVGYVYKRLLNHISHKMNYHGFRANFQIQLFDDFGGMYIQYDFVKGDKYMFGALDGSDHIEVVNKFYGEPVVGFFYGNTSYDKPLAFYLGVSPYRYEPRNYEQFNGKPFKDLGIVFKIKYTINTERYF